MQGITVRLRSKALADVSRIRDWYRIIDPTLEKRFVQSLNGCLNRLEISPYAYPISYRNTRRILLDRFPYGVFFLIQNTRVVVLAVIHQKRNPELSQRISE